MNLMQRKQGSRGHQQGGDAGEEAGPAVEPVPIYRSLPLLCAVLFIISVTIWFARGEVSQDWCCTCPSWRCCTPNQPALHPLRPALRTPGVASVGGGTSHGHPVLCSSRGVHSGSRRSAAVSQAAGWPGALATAALLPPPA